MQRKHHGKLKPFGIGHGAEKKLDFYNMAELCMKHDTARPLPLKDVDLIKAGDKPRVSIDKMVSFTQTFEQFAQESARKKRKTARRCVARHSTYEYEARRHDPDLFPKPRPRRSNATSALPKDTLRERHLGQNMAMTSNDRLADIEEDDERAEFFGEEEITREGLEVHSAKWKKTTPSATGVVGDEDEEEDPIRDPRRRYRAIGQSCTS